MDNAKPVLHDLHVNFMDLKRSYSTDDLETDNQTMVFLKATSEIRRVEVYLNRCENESLAISFGKLNVML